MKPTQDVMPLFAQTSLGLVQGYSRLGVVHYKGIRYATTERFKPPKVADYDHPT